MTRPGFPSRGPTRPTARILPAALAVMAVLSVTAGAANAGEGVPGRPLAPGASLRNDAAAPVYLLHVLAPGADFANTTGATLRVLTPRELRELADTVADPEVIAREDAIARLEARLAELDAALAGLDTRRGAVEEEAP